MIPMRLTHIERRLERLLASRSKRRVTAIPRCGAVAPTSRKTKLRKRKANRS